MAIIKESMFPAMGPDGEPLVRLLDELPSDAGLEKTAGIHPEILAYKQQLEPEPGKTYVHILALGAGDFYGPNLNNDHFPWEGLQHDHTKMPHPHMHGYKTFLNAHAFAHHANKDPEKAYGDVLVSVLNKKMKRVELIVAIDEEKCIRNGGQRTLDKIKAGEYPSTSMGCRVPFDVCSICGHKAKYRSEYCDHMRNEAGKIYADGRKVFVYNPYPRFFDISFVFIGADRTSFVLEKVAHLEQQEKAAMINAVKNLNWTTAGIGGRMLGGAAVGGLSGAMASDDGFRVQGALKGALGGAALAGTVGQLTNSGIMGNIAAGATGGTMLAATNPALSGSSTTLGQTKVASFNSAMRRQAGTTEKYLGMRVPRKVQRQSKLGIRPLTFSKLKNSAKDVKREQDKMLSLVFDPLPSITVNDGAESMYGRMATKSAALKNATVTKLSDIFKEVDASPMGRAVRMIEGPEPNIPCGQLDDIARTPDLGATLSGMAGAGIVLKPQEFQRVVLMRTGHGPMADDLHRRGVVFPERAPVMRSMRIMIRPPEQDAIPQGIMDLIGNLLSRRSALTPLALRREQPSAPGVRVIRIHVGANPVLDKVASLYNGYREDVLLNTEGLIKSAMMTPVLMRHVESARGIGGHDGGPAFHAMSQLPLAYFSHAYWNRCCCDRTLSDREFAEKFTEENPEIAKYLATQVASDCANT